MPIPIEHSEKILASQFSPEMLNLFAQGHAKRLLIEVGEPIANFPNFTSNLDDNTTASAYAILAASLSLYELNQHCDSVTAPDLANIQQRIAYAAQIIVNAHIDNVRRDENSAFHILTASMAFYVAAQYSKAFIAIKSATTDSVMVRMLHLYLKRDRDELIRLLNTVLLTSRAPVNCISEVAEPAITLTIAKALANLLEYQASGEKQYWRSAVAIAENGLRIAIELEEPLFWWLLRLLRIMLIEFEKHSLWSLLTPHFPDSAELLKEYIQASAFSVPAVTELWRSQECAVQQIFSPEIDGLVINMRTSAGKTRIAELMILHTLAKSPEAKVLYLAPFRSLAIEIEQMFSNIFEVLGFKVSFLYGGFRFNASDRSMASEATITIATPEKAKAMFRASPELFSSYKLVIIDEGHLLGNNDRLIRNELFFEHIRRKLKVSNGRLLLLSAVLPNPEDLAQWIGGSSNKLVKSAWKPADERTGYLEWTGRQVDLEWNAQYRTFNNAFITQHNNFPCNKNEAIAATAIKLSAIGPAMIFCGQARSVLTMASAVLKGLQDSKDMHPWPPTLWKMYKSICEEEIGPESIEYIAAQKGIICHSNRLPSQLRMVTEKLMRCSIKPKIIIATSTLAQGVNIGLSSVIISSLMQGGPGQYVEHRDFWNICGRAGRAFVDFEGKILYTLDLTKESKAIQRDKWHAKRYFDKHQSAPSISGLLSSLTMLYTIAQEEGIDWNNFLSLIAENDFSSLNPENQKEINRIFDLVDDTLIAIADDQDILIPESDSIDTVFRASLAAIQTRYENQLEANGIVAILQNRLSVLTNETPQVENRRIFTASGLPYKYAKIMHDKNQEILAAINQLDEYEELLKWFEEWSRNNIIEMTSNWPEKEHFDLIRLGWLAGTPISELSSLSPQATRIIKDIYSYQLPWFLHSAAQVLLRNDHPKEAELLEQLSSMVEFGLPDALTINIFQAGIRSRQAACELSSLELDWGNSFKKVKHQINSSKWLEYLLEKASEKTRCWLEYVQSSVENHLPVIHEFEPFRLSKDIAWDKLYVRILAGEPYLCSIDGSWKEAYEASDQWNWNSLADDLRYVFKKVEDGYIFESRDPHHFKI